MNPKKVIFFLGIFLLFFISKYSESFGQITQITQVGEIPQDWCYKFTQTLYYGKQGKEVQALQIALKKEGFTIFEEELKNSFFGESTAAAVVSFQEKYASEILTPLGLSKGTGIVGNLTRAKLNKIFECKKECKSDEDCMWCGRSCILKSFPSSICPQVLPPPDTQCVCREGKCVTQTFVPPPPVEDPVFGSLSVNKNVVSVGEEIVLTIKAKDENGVERVMAYYQGRWHSENCGGQKECTKSFTFSEQTPGVKYYYGYVYGKKSNGAWEGAYTNPSYVRVEVKKEISCPQISPQCGKSIHDCISSAKILERQYPGCEYAKLCSQCNYPLYCDEVCKSKGYERGSCVTFPSVISPLISTSTQTSWPRCEVNVGLTLDCYPPIFFPEIGPVIETKYCCCERTQEPKIQVLSPNGGERWELKGTYMIKWKTLGMDFVDIELVSEATGTQRISIAKKVPASIGEYLWTIPTDLPPGNLYKIKILDSSDPSIYDESDGFFSIVFPYFRVKILHPNGGEKFSQGAPIVIYWSDFPPDISRREAELYYIESSSVIPIGKVKNTGVYFWLPPQNLVSDSIKVKVCIEGVCDESDGYFSILPKTSPQPLSCEDSDRGKNYYEKGMVVITFDGERKVYTDECANEKTLYEYFCPETLQSGVGKEEVTCPYGCQEGICKREPTFYTLTLSKWGNGGVRSTDGKIVCLTDYCPNPEASYEANTKVILRAYPDPGSTFLGWSGDCSGTNFTCEVTMDGNKRISANFTRTYTLYLYKNLMEGGNVVSSPYGIICDTTCLMTNYWFQEGAQVTLTATPSSGYRISSWVGCDSISSNQCIVRMNTNKTVRVYFEKIITPTPTIPTSTSNLLPDLVVTDIFYDYPYIRVKYCNLGEGVGSGDFLIKLRNNQSGQEFGGNPYYRFAIPRPKECKLTGGYTPSLIGLTYGQTASVTAIIDWEQRVVESNENNNTFTKTISASTGGLSEILASLENILKQLQELLKR